ncbi:receptor activity-modifying protein 2 isoform X2 [Anabas testudineus]|uniref:receptor activity-modifying protein 2 isoform X2 n=1 Tax=Anabas testudineus TaxID=64144 RepID=UPI000E45484C|nr:receptor activity-modifying protein 2 isoform X2 [Anabas testudineus]
MTATSSSLGFSGGFVTLLIWGCTAVVCLVDEKLAVEPATTMGYHSPLMSAEPMYGESTLPLACGTATENCPHFCNFCNGLPKMDCHSMLSKHLCHSNFMSAMASLNSTDWCIWDNVRDLYSNLSLCTEEISDCLLIPWPNSLVEEIFVNIHSLYFKDCATEELRDPPSAVVFALVVTPICLIPIMVSLVVLKTKNGDGSS